MITNYKNIKPSLACVFVQNGNSWKKIDEAIDKRVLKITQDDLNKTKLLTIHGSKGLEADTVFLHTAIPGAVKKAMLTPKGTENEAYVWYVGITRAIKNLIFVTYTGQNFPIPGVCA
jgi:superfamily I DNA/RNA helicase